MGKKKEYSVRLVYTWEFETTVSAKDEDHARMRAQGEASELFDFDDMEVVESDVECLEDGEDEVLSSLANGGADE